MATDTDGDWLDDEDDEELIEYVKSIREKQDMANRLRESLNPDITHARECPECGGETYQFERCHLCGDIPWKEGENER